MELSLSHIKAPKPEVPPRVELTPDAINKNQLSRLKTNREIARKGNKLIDEANKYCLRLIDQFFKYMTANVGNIEGQADLLQVLNRQWSAYVRRNSAKYVYTETQPFFIEKVMFMIGDKKYNEAQIEKIKAAGLENNSETL